MKKVVVTMFSLGSIFCILYYSIRFYLERTLTFTEASLMPWGIICFIIATCLIIGISNSIRIEFVLKQNTKLLEKNEELKQLVVALSEKTDVNHFSELHQIKNCQELILDVGD